MKKNIPTLLKAELRTLRVLSLVFLVGSLLCDSSKAGTVLDRKYALESVGFVRAWDNVDNLFSDYVAEAYTEYFKKSSRFRLHDLSKTDPILSRSTIPYRKVIEDVDILAQVARVGRVQTLLRTRVYKEGPRYRFAIDWLHAPKMHILSQHEFYYNEPKSGNVFGSEAIREELHQALDRLIEHLPFAGQVSGRDQNWVTVNFGSQNGLKKGDTLIVQTIEDVKTHPLLNTLVDWKFSRIGTMVVDSADARIAFAEIIDEESGRKITRYQKITKVIPVQKEKEPTLIIEDENLERARRQQLPKTGWGAVGPWLGVLNRSYSDSSLGRKGDAFLWGLKADGQLWLNRNFFFELELGIAGYSYSQKHNVTEVETSTGNSGNVIRFRTNVGYNYYVTGDFWGPKAWARIGYRSHAYSFPLNSSERLGPSSWNDLFIGVGGDLPIRGRYGALLWIDYGLFKGQNVEGLPLTEPDSSHDVSFFVGGYWRWTHRMTIRAGLDAMFHGVEFSDNSTMSQTAFSFAPSLIYYF